MTENERFAAEKERARKLRQLENSLRESARLAGELDLGMAVDLSIHRASVGNVAQRLEGDVWGAEAFDRVFGD